MPTPAPLTNQLAVAPAGYAAQLLEGIAAALVERERPAQWRVVTGEDELGWQGMEFPNPPKSWRLGLLHLGPSIAERNGAVED